MMPLNLLCLSSGGCYGGCSAEMPVDLAGEVTLERASDFAQGAPFCGAFLDVGAGVRVHTHAGDYRHVECAVEASVTAAVDPVAHGVAGRGGDRVDTGEAGERGFGADASRV